MNKEWKPFVNNRVGEIRPPCLLEPLSRSFKSCRPTLKGVDLNGAVRESALETGTRQTGFEPGGSFEPGGESDMPRECSVELKATQHHNLLSMKSKKTLEAVLDPANSALSQG